MRVVLCSGNRGNGISSARSPSGVQTPGFAQFPQILNGASSLIQEVFGPDIGDHARVAIGVGVLPFNVPVEIEAELELA